MGINVMTYALAKKYTDQQVASLGTSFSYEIVESLPATGEPGCFYFVAKSESEGNFYDEYLFINGKFELVGTTEIDFPQVYWKDIQDKPFGEEIPAGEEPDVMLYASDLMEGPSVVLDWDIVPSEKPYLLTVEQSRTYFPVWGNTSVKFKITESNNGEYNFEIIETIDNDELIAMGNLNFSATDDNKLQISSSGQYFSYYHYFTLYGCKGVTYTTIDDKFISDNIARTSDVETAISDVQTSIAEVGTSLEAYKNAVLKNASDIAGLQTNLDKHTHSWNDLKDKPFGEIEEERTEVFRGTIVTDDNGYFVNEKYDEEDDMPYWQFEFNYPAYRTIKGYITLNGIEHELYPHDELAGRPLVTPDDSEVSIYLQSDWDSFNIYGLEPNTSYEVKFEYIEGQTIYLNDKYLSENIARKSDIEELSWNDLNDKPFSETIETKLKRLTAYNTTLTSDNEGKLYFSGCFTPDTTNIIVLNDGDRELEYRFDAIYEDGDNKLVFDYDGAASSSYGSESFYGEFYGWYIAGVLPNTTYTIKFEYLDEVEEETVKTIDDKYISENIARTSWVEALQAEIQELREMVTALQAALSAQE